MLHRIKYELIGFFLSEKDRIALWLPVLFGSGIGFYFSLKTEPLFITSFCFFICGCFLLWDSRGNRVYFYISLFIFLFFSGIFVTQLRTYTLSSARIKTRTGILEITGKVQDVLELPEGRSRLVLKDLSIETLSEWQTPAKIWLNTPSSMNGLAQSGDIIKAMAYLQPPYQASTPTSFDFNRHLYFHQIGGTGFVREYFQILKHSASSSIREKINKRIDKVMARETSGIAKALVTGSTKSIAPDIIKHYRDAGIAHILSVSGLHMSLLSGLIFVMIRTILALIPRIALMYDTKKIAAIISIFVCFIYLHLSGSSYPAQRSFLMLSFVMIAILFNRRALSLVSLAWSAFFILLLFPESVCSAGFQLSFSAVIALICAYEAGIGKYIRLLEKKEGLLFYLFSCLAAIALTTIIASFATAPFTIFHFRRLPVYSLIGNLLSSTITGFWIMPSLTAGTILMPFGFDVPFLKLASAGIFIINKAAAFTSGLPHAVYQFPPMPFYGLMMAVFGGLWFCLWQGRHRIYGLIFFCLSIVTPFFTPTPDIYVSANTAAFRNDEGLLIFREGLADQAIKRTWLEENKQARAITMICPYGLCIYEKNGQKIGYAHTRIGAYDACQIPDLSVLITSVSLANDCFSGERITRTDLLNKGVHTLYLLRNGTKITSVIQEKGFRPWTTSYPSIGIADEIRQIMKKSPYRIKGRLEERVN